MITTHCCPQFWHSKKNSDSTQFIELYFGISEQIKPLQPIGQAAEFKFESKFKPLPTNAGHLAITLEDYARRQSKYLTAKSMAKLFGPRSGRLMQAVPSRRRASTNRVFPSRTGEHKHRAFPSRQESLQTATCALEENVLPLLRY